MITPKIRKMIIGREIFYTDRIREFLARRELTQRRFKRINLAIFAFLYFVHSA
jgi:hypothetical protein